MARAPRSERLVAAAGEIASATWEVAMGEIAREWRQIEQRTHACVASWTERLEGMTREEDALRAAGRWVRGRTDWLGVLGKQRDELVHSRMIAWLLDPCRPHGLGSRLLKAIAAEVSGEEVRDLERARVRCEVPVGEGRIDILVTREPDFHLLIENKVDADEASDQCRYYREHAEYPGARFVFLTPDGRRASDEAFVCLSYRRLSALLAQVLRDAPGAAARHIAEEYLRTLSQEFP
jgi:hypothetical protein